MVWLWYAVEAAGRSFGRVATPGRVEVSGLWQKVRFLNSSSDMKVHIIIIVVIIITIIITVTTIVMAISEFKKTKHRKREESSSGDQEEEV